MEPVCAGNKTTCFSSNRDLGLFHRAGFKGNLLIFFLFLFTPMCLDFIFSSCESLLTQRGVQDASVTCHRLSVIQCNYLPCQRWKCFPSLKTETPHLSPSQSSFFFLLLLLLTDICTRRQSLSRRYGGASQQGHISDKW